MELLKESQAVPVAWPLANVAVSQRWLQLAKSTTSTLRRRGSSLQHRLGVIRDWEQSHPMPPAAHVPGPTPATQRAQSPPAGTSEAPASQGSPKLPPSLVREQLSQYTPLLSDGEAASWDPLVRATLLHMASLLASPGGDGTGTLTNTSSGIRIAQAATAWLSYNSVSGAAQAAGRTFQDGHSTALLLYNRFPEALPSALWSVLWLCVSLLLQPLRGHSVIEKLGHALYSAKELLAGREDLQQLQLQLHTPGPGASNEPNTIQYELSALSALTSAGCSLHSMSVPLTSLPEPGRFVDALPAGSPSSPGPTHAAQVTIWPLITCKQLPTESRAALVRFFASRYQASAPTSEQCVYLPVCARSIETTQEKDESASVQQHSARDTSQSAVTVVWLAGVSSSWLQQQQAAPVDGPGDSNPLVSTYCPRIRISNLGTDLARRWTAGIAQWQQHK